MSQPAHYVIRVKGHLSSQWAGRFGGMAIENHPNGEAALSGVLPDQSALYGILRQIHNLGLTLVSVQRAELDPVASQRDWKTWVCHVGLETQSIISRQSSREWRRAQQQRLFG